MSSPLSNLKKPRKAPMFMGGISQPGNRSVPFRGGPEYLTDDNLLLDEVTSGMVGHVRSSRGTPLPRLAGGGVTGSPRSQSIPAAAPSDGDLMSLMMTRLAALEQRIALQSKDIADKDRKIKIYEDKIRILQKSRDEGNPGRCAELEKRCLMLQKQTHDMEAFLADYGMVWVGADVTDDDVYHDADLVSLSDDDNAVMTSSSPLWHPGTSSVTGDDFHVDYDLIVKNVEELNVLAGEGVAKIQHTTDGARLKIPDAVSLTLYANGLLMFDGPFRPLTDPATRTCLTDLMDGFFPSELQTRYPDGVPIAVRDKRGVYFKDRLTFAGRGEVLGGETRPSRLLPSNLDKTTSPYKTTSLDKTTSPRREESTIPGRKLSVDQFLSKLPSSVIKNGRVVDVRGGLAEMLTSSPSSEHTVHVVETAAVEEMKERMSIDESQRPPSSRHVTTLRIKSEEGETFIVKMKFTETIRDLRSYLDKLLSPGTRYHILSTFPRRTYNDVTATLQECGLIPNATLHLRLVKS